MTSFTNGLVARARTISLAWLVVAFSVAQLLDLVSALVVAREMNPIVASMVKQPALGFALKFALIALVVATAEICDRRRRRGQVGGQATVGPPHPTGQTARSESDTVSRGPVAQR